MTDSQRLLLSEGIERQWLLEFDAAQLIVATNADGVSHFIESTYRHMLTNEIKSLIGRIDIAHGDDGFVLSSTETLRIAGDDCAPLLPFLKEEIVVRFMQARPDLLWLHAAGIENKGDALLIVGPTGQGKSTLSTLLCERGWRLMSDDVAPVRMNTRQLLAFPQSPLRRLTTGREVSPLEIGSLMREEVRVSATDLNQQPARIVGAVFPTFKFESGIEWRQLSKGDGAMELLKNVRNLWDHRAMGVEWIAEAAQEVPMFQLCYGSSIEAVEIIQEYF